jgi:hypothetical protein
MKNHCGDKQDFRGVLPPLRNVPDAIELVRDCVCHTPIAKFTSDVRPRFPLVR